MQRHLTRIGLYKDKLDGKAGMQTRAALGAYQKSAGLKVDCWPSEARAALDECGALTFKEKKPGRIIGRALKSRRAGRALNRSDQLQTSTRR